MDRFPLTPETARLIVALVRAGGGLRHAAEAAGIPGRILLDWLRRGRDSEDPPFGPFYQQMMEARGQARAAVETEVRRKDPKFWLRYGPGKQAENPSRKKQRAGATISALLTGLLPVLDPWPEARQAVVDYLARPPS